MLLQSLIFALLGGRIDTYRNVKNTSEVANRREQRNRQIRNEYQAKFQKGLRSEVILQSLALRWCLAEDTVERIVFQRGYYREVGLVMSSNTQPAQA